MATLSFAPPQTAPRPTASEDAELFRRYRESGNAADREALVHRFLPLARHVASRYRHGEEGEDVMQVAALGLLKAIERYDPDRGIAFSTFAVPTVLGEVKRYFRDLGWSVRVPRDVQELSLRIDRVTEDLTGELGRVPTTSEIARACEVTDEQVLEARGTHTAHRAVSLDQPAREPEDDAAISRLGGDDPGFARVEDATQLEQLVAVLGDRERQILLLRFGGDLKQREIAQLMGISQMQVSRLISQS